MYEDHRVAPKRVGQSVAVTVLTSTMHAHAAMVQLSILESAGDEDKLKVLAQKAVSRF